MGATVLLPEIKHCRAPPSSQSGMKILRQCLHTTLLVFLIWMQYTENHFNVSVQMQLGLYKCLEKMCVTTEKKKILKGCRQSSPDNSDLSQCFHPSHASEDILNNILLNKSKEIELDISTCLFWGFLGRWEVHSSCLQLLTHC